MALTQDEVALSDAIARLHRALRRAASARVVQMELPMAQLELLSSLAEHPGARPGQLAHVLCLAPTTVTLLVGALEGRGLLVRAAGGADRRAVLLSLTKSGRQAVDQWHAAETAILRAALDGLDPAWRQLLGVVLPALRELTGAVDALAEAQPARADDASA